MPYKPFRSHSRRTSPLPEQWQSYARRERTPSIWFGAIAATLLGGLIGVGSLQLGGEVNIPFGSLHAASGGRDPINRIFGLCHVGGGTNCVVDGDTIWLDGEKIRIADIDAPETHPPRCDHEASLGSRATTRLRELLNAGPFALRSIGSRDEDQYGRKLRVLTRDGRSIGDMLVSDGLARTWDGKRRSWC